ncbi:MAG: sigma-54-dependent Fis family transcriptional regulator [Betaproteobacteria bacterium]|nr:sigma-54-dependent Fis family transcriptional regulator [Betaproteobacteria bacterium]
MSAAPPSSVAAGLGNWQPLAALVVDDEPGMRNFIERSLKERCGVVASAASAEEGARLIERQHFDLVILDIALPGKHGVEWLHELRAQGFTGDVILITAFSSIEMAIDALRAGASDFILKPFRVDQLLTAIKRCVDRAALARQNFVLRREVAEITGTEGIEGLVGMSDSMRSLTQVVKRLAPMRTTVLIQGESGTGKEVAARALHNMGPQSGNPFVPLNCAAISPELLESELFGHVKGAFTGATANHTGLFFYAQGGTLFLDEISEMPLALQSKMLRVLEERKIRPVGTEKEVAVDVRIVAATNRDLKEEVAAGRFRQDLFYRLDVLTLRIPPLRERREDIAVLAMHFRAQFAAQLGIAPVDWTREDLEVMQSYDWPGNARELRNFVERSFILGYFPIDTLRPAGLPRPKVSAAGPIETMEEVEKRHILAVLEAVGGNKSEAARRLGLSRKTLDRKCAEWGVKGHG